MDSYWTVQIGYQETDATEWHPTEPMGPFSVLSRGCWDTQVEALDWASRELGQGNWLVVEVQAEAE